MPQACKISSKITPKNALNASFTPVLWAITGRLKASILASKANTKNVAFLSTFKYVDIGSL